MKQLLDMVVRYYKNEARLVQRLLVSFPINVYLTRSIYHHLLKYLEIIVRALRAAYYFSALIEYHQLIFVSGSGLHADSLIMPCPLPHHTFSSPFTQLYWKATKNRLPNRVLSRSQCCLRLPVFIDTVWQHRHPHKQLGSPTTLILYRHPPLQK